ncbi:Acetolactate synthase small subunit [subsurface metagenome]|nr:acetolactate synthase small subunit [Hadesarchaea archaeon]
MKTRIFSVLCENVPGVMMRISRTFTRRQINLDSITVGLEPTGLARIILMFKEDDRMAEFMRRVLVRLEPIVDVEVIEPERSIVREVTLLKTRKLNKKQLWQMVQQVERAGGRVLESKGNMVIAELSGEHDEIERVIKALGPKILKEVARSGQVLISRVK